MSSKSRVLVTGGAGFVGSNIVELLVAEGCEVFVLDNLSLGYREAVVEGAELIVGDVGDSERVSSILREKSIDSVVHMAADAAITKSMTDPGVFFRENFSKGIELLEAMAKCGVTRLVFSSTAATYGEPLQVPIDEEHPTRPINPYGLSKLMFEQVLPWYRRVYGLEYVCLRYFNAAGASERCGEYRVPETHLIPLVLGVALGRRDQVSIYGDQYPTDDGSCVRDYVHVSDMARAHFLALGKLDSIGAGIYNVASGGGDSVKEVIAMAREVTGHAIPATVEAPRPGDPAVLVADASKAKRELGWEPARALKEIVQDAWAWQRANPEGYRE